MSTDDPHLILYPSLRGLLAVLLTPHLLIVLGAWGLTGGANTVAIGMVVIGIVTAATGLYSYPRHVVLSPDGIELVSVLRRRRLPWEQVRGIERTRPGSARRLKARYDGADGGAGPSGGLLARGHGRRRWMMTDHVESVDEYDRLCAIVLAAPGSTRVGAARPDDATPPTWLYRRRSPA
ncbi:MAG TPA: PH domain-containing protein [Egicoccus sp.]|nr:PH domain-containing protein [Egicoccus sp.]HSK24105.1 PH domain-containing protein [Egicoccus sp.]